MGRRKIEIKAIKDDRNRSVTFLKRKGGLFKKAHELSVLCSVDVAVIIFGQNKKLYEFSSGDIRETLQRYTFYGGPHEHKGPSDFAGKGGGDDDDDDDDNMGSPPPEEPSPPHHGVVPPHFQPHLGPSNMRGNTQSASPPINGSMFPPRMGTPPSQNASRPASRTHSRRPSSNLVPPNQRQPHASQPPPQPGGHHINYSYPPNASFYQNAAAQNMHMNHQHQHQQQQQQQQQHNMQAQRHVHNFGQPQPPPHSQLQQMYLHEQRRHSMSPSYPMHTQPERAQHHPVVETPPHIQRPFQSPPLPEPKSLPGPPKANSIDTGRPNAQSGWQIHEGTRSDQNVRAEQNMRSQSIDMGSALRNRANGTSPQQTFTQPSQPPARADSVSASSDFATPSRMNSISDAKRPRLKVQIPSEQSENGSATGESSGKDGERTSGATPIKASNSESTHSSGVVLPPPSPSASAILSAGATGPTNPFARPPPKSSSGLNQSTSSFKDNETPISALPSRYISDTFLASPSNLFPDWNFGSMSHNNLASPATYQPSPIRPERPSFKDEPPEKRRISDEEGEATPNKKAKQ